MAAVVFEATLLGTGGGYGESQVIHLGENHWIVIDSCEDPKTKMCLPLDYLQKRGVDTSTDVKMIICTHWHDDHIRGMGRLLQSCESAVFVMAKATDRDKFLRLIGLDNRKQEFGASVSSTEELNLCLNLLEAREAELKMAIEDRLLLSYQFDKGSYQIFALSPSDFVMNEFDKEISTLITEYGVNTNRKIIVQPPNFKSVVIYIKANNICALFGADLEVDENSSHRGWLRILDHSQVVDKKSNLYKVPHHGSRNGDHDRIWNDLLESLPISLLTPWNRNTKLPKREMLERIKTKSHSAFITSTLSSGRDKPKIRDRSILKAIQLLKPSLREVVYHYGRVTLCANSQSNTPVWCTEVDGTAKQITDLLINDFR